MSDFNQRYDMAFKCPKCELITDQNLRSNCNHKLSKENEFSLRETWWEPPEPEIPYEELILEEDKFETDAEYTKAEKMFPDIKYGSEKRTVPSKEELKRIIEILKWANKLDGHYSRAIIDAGACFYLMGENIKAIECWACEVDQYDPESLFYLFKLYKKMNWKYHAFDAARTIAISDCPSDELEERCKEIQANSNIITNDNLLELEKLVEKTLDDCFGLEDLFKII